MLRKGWLIIIPWIGKLVYWPDESFSIEVKISSNPRHIYGNRSYAQKTRRGEKLSLDTILRSILRSFLVFQLLLFVNLTKMNPWVESLRSYSIIFDRATAIAVSHCLCELKGGGNGLYRTGGDALLADDTARSHEG
jgi:hypothetical protein